MIWCHANISMDEFSTMRALRRGTLRRGSKRPAAIIAAGIFSAAATAAYFFFPVASASILSGAATIVGQSWDDTFGTTNGGYRTIEIALSRADDGANDNVQDGDILNTAEAAGSGDGVGVFDGVLPSGDAVGSSDEITVTNTVSTTATATTASIEPPLVASEQVSSSEQTQPEQASSTSAQPPPGPPAPCGLALVSASAPPSSYAVIVNEIAWMGSVPLPGESASKAANREWIELKNMTDGAVDVSGWQLEDASGKLDVALDSGAAIPAHGFYLLERGGGAAASGTLPGVAADGGYSGALSNNGDDLALFTESCGVADRVLAADGWLAGDNTTKQTAERNTDGYGWHTSVAAGGTPRAENSAPPPPPASSSSQSGGGSAAGVDDEEVNASSETATTTTSTAASAETEGATSTVAASVTTTICTVVTVTSTAATSTETTEPTSTASSTPPAGPLLPVIAEVQIAGDASDNDFVKIFNPAAGLVDVSGWHLRKRSKSGADYSLRVFPDGSTIAPYGYFVWANSSDGFGGAMGADVTSTETLAADNSAGLLDASGTVVDAVAWGEGADQYVEGNAYPTEPGANEVLKRRFAGGIIIDTGDNATDFVLGP